MFWIGIASALAFHPEAERFLAAVPEGVLECNAQDGERLE